MQTGLTSHDLQPPALTLQPLLNRNPIKLIIGLLDPVLVSENSNPIYIVTRTIVAMMNANQVMLIIVGVLVLGLFFLIHQAIVLADTLPILSIYDWVSCSETRTSFLLHKRFVFAGWEVPLPYLQLCELCRALPSSGSTIPRIQHHDNFLDLRRSGEQGCWCCLTVCEQLAISIQDHDSPPLNSDLTHLKIPHLLLWFAEQTWTETGYLDHLRQIGRRLSIPRSTAVY